jgi:hypothetical protein
MSECYILLVLGSLTEEEDFSHRLLVENKQSNTNCPTVTPVSDWGQTIDIEIFSFG